MAGHVHPGSGGSVTTEAPPTQYLILEVLAARHRLGETYWTFPTRCRPAARRLEVAGLVTLRPAPTYGSFEARLTEAGTVNALGLDYVPPLDAAADAMAKELTWLHEELLALRDRAGMTPGNARNDGRALGLEQAASMVHTVIRRLAPIYGTPGKDQL